MLWSIVVVVGLLLIGLAGFVAFYHGLHHVPAGYQRALETAPEVQARGSEEMVQKVTSLGSDLRRQGSWQALFTEAQINGWLAIDLSQNHPQTLPAEIREPRVVIEPEQVTVAFRFVQGRWDTVVSLAVEPYVPEPNVLALRFRKARAGSLPLPLSQILEQVPRIAQRLDLQVQWRQADGDPVALLRFPTPNRDKRQVQLESLRLGQGELYLSGTTRRP